jgi:hypothetical protein
MRDELFIKITNATGSKKIKRLVSVCAWCPKDSYPELADSEEYTHGLCEKHYQMLSKHSLKEIK